MPDESKSKRAEYKKIAPGAIAAMWQVENYVRRCGLEPSLIELVKLRASLINGCGYCVDMHTQDARSLGESEQRLSTVSVWRETPFFSPREQAALAWTEAVTEISHHHVPDELYNLARQHFTEKELVNLTMAVIAINGWNRLAITFRSFAGTYHPESHPANSHPAGMDAHPERIRVTVTTLQCARALEREHQVIQQAVAAASVMADRLEQSQPLNHAQLRDLAEFLHEYADRLHHEKEERLLFPLLEKRGVPASGCPLAALRHEHETGRALVSELSALAGTGGDDSGRREQVLSVLRRLVKLYIEHVWKEDYLLIPMSAKVLSAEDDAALAREFEAADVSFGSPEREKFESFAAGLEHEIVEAGTTV
jgi:AhpD family alkylhydroperoxidase